jgi:hypothetical protein
MVIGLHNYQVSRDSSTVSRPVLVSMQLMDPETVSPKIKNR